MGGPPYVFSFNGIPTRLYLVVRRYRLEMLTTAIRHAARVAVLSDAAAGCLRRHLLHDPVVLPPGVALESFAVEEERAPEPTLLCAASLGDPRKRAGLLLAAFARLRADIPEARLVLVRSRDAAMSGEEPIGGDGVEWIETDSTEQLARVYASAWASVLPAPDEAFGLVLVESLAAGTPVVAARSGGCPEIVDDERIGRLFEPDDELALAEAMREALELSGGEGTSALCRERAAEYDWSRLIGRYESLYEQAADGRESALSTGDERAQRALERNPDLWYHAIELAPGIVTPGSIDLRKPAAKLLPPRLDGVRALDVATFDGFWAFEMERRGAEVVAIDLERIEQVEFPPLRRERLEREAAEQGFELGHGFRVAAEALASKVQRVPCNVYDLEPGSDRRERRVRALRCPAASPARPRSRPGADPAHARAGRGTAPLRAVLGLA